MGCFIAPATEALVVTAVDKLTEHKEIKTTGFVYEMKQKASWLKSMLWGGSGLLAFEHLWHGELQPFFPFLTAASNHEDFMAMVHEISTTGVAMAAAVTVVWLGMVATTSRKKKSVLQKQKTQK